MASDDGCLCCGNLGAARNERQVSQMIDQQLHAEAVDRGRLGEKFILVIGFQQSASASFVSTVQMLYKTDAFPNEDQTDLKRNIRRTTVQCMVSLLAGMRSLDIDFENPETGASADKVLGIDVEKLEEVSAEHAESLRVLWNDSAVQRCFTLNWQEFGLLSSAGYFFNSVERISQPDYAPSDSDRMKLSQCFSSVPVIEFLLEIEHCVLAFACIGKLKRKHFHCFEHARAVLLLASAGGYNVGGETSDNGAELDGILQRVKYVTQSPCFRHADIHIILTDKDILSDNVKHCQQRDYSAGVSRSEEGHVDAAITRIRTMFGEACRKADQGQDREDVFFHCINATEADEVRRVILSVRDTILLTNRWLYKCLADGLT